MLAAASGLRLPASFFNRRLTTVAANKCQATTTTTAAHFCGQATFEKEISFHLIAARDLIRTHFQSRTRQGGGGCPRGRGMSPHATATHMSS